MCVEYNTYVYIAIIYTLGIYSNIQCLYCQYIANDKTEFYNPVNNDYNNKEAYKMCYQQNGFSRMISKCSLAISL